MAVNLEIDRILMNLAQVANRGKLFSPANLITCFAGDITLP